MNLLALETSTNACSVALQCGGELVERHVVQPKEHTRLLIPMIGDVLREGNVALSGLDAIVLGNGPGSFIGMRIAASVAQGLAYGAGLGIVAVSSLAAIAAEVFATAPVHRVAVAQDAHMNEVYLALFHRGEGGLPVADGDTVLQPVERVASAPGFADGGFHAAGAGWERYPELLRLNAGALAGRVEVASPRASFLLAAGAAAVRSGAVIEPARLVPDYVRSKVASIPASSR